MHGEQMKSVLEAVMKNIFSKDCWRWEMYRHVALFVHHPSEVNQSKLTALIKEFRQQVESQERVVQKHDEHEYVMNYR